MRKYQSKTQVLRQLKKQGLVNLSSTNNIKAIYFKFEKCDSVHDTHCSGHPSCSDKVIKEINDYISKHPDTSPRKISKIMNESHMTDRNVLKNKQVTPETVQNKLFSCFN